MSAEREAFERWYYDYGHIYTGTTKADALEIWQAGRAALLAEIKAGGATGRYHDAKPTYTLPEGK